VPLLAHIYALYVGPLCAVCSEDFAYQASTQQCEPCSDSYQFDLYAAVLVVVSLGLVGVAGRYFIPRMRVVGREIRDVDDLILSLCMKIGIFTPYGGDSFALSYETLRHQAQTLMRRFNTRMKIYVNLWQIGSILPLALDLRFPDLYALVVSTLSVLDLSVSKSSLIDCSSARYDAIDALVIDTSIPLVLVTLLWITATLHISIASRDPDHKREKELRSLRSRFFSAFKIYTFLILPGRSAQIFSVFSCKDVDPDGVNEGDDSYMTTDYSVSCSSAKYQFGQAWAIAMVFVYPIGIPLFYFILLYRSRHDIQSRNDASLSTEQHTLLSQRTDPIRSLFELYKPHLWYWEVVETISRLMLTGVLVLIAQGSAIQIVIGVIFSITIMLVHNYVVPYTDSDLQRARRISHWQICGLFFISLLLKADFKSMRRSTLGVFLLLILFCGLANDISLCLWHYTLPRSVSPDSHEFSCEDRPIGRSSKASVRQTEGGGTMRLTQGGSIDLVDCDSPNKVFGGRDSSIIRSSPLHEERL
jgi:hypothetical protein